MPHLFLCTLVSLLLSALLECLAVLRRPRDRIFHIVRAKRTDPTTTAVPRTVEIVAMRIVNEVFEDVLPVNSTRVCIL